MSRGALVCQYVGAFLSGFAVVAAVGLVAVHLVIDSVWPREMEYAEYPVATTLVPLLAVSAEHGDRAARALAFDTLTGIAASLRAQLDGLDDAKAREVRAVLAKIEGLEPPANQPPRLKGGKQASTRTTRGRGTTRSSGARRERP